MRKREGTARSLMRVQSDNPCRLATGNSPAQRIGAGEQSLLEFVAARPSFFWKTPHHRDIPFSRTS
jgi:hypothetical protein